jgi:lipoyl(octanoyl) transferase
MNVEWLGRINYADGLTIQEQHLQTCIANGEERILLLEHEPVYTIGRLLDKSSLGEASQLPHPVYETNRGGQATYHGPGQLVGYLILDLRKRGRDLHVYMRTIEAILIDLLRRFGIDASRIEGKTGVWVQNRKIASIGVGVKKWITMHGFALNVARDMTGFASITPCGIVGVQMTAMSLEIGRDVSLDEVRGEIEPLFERHLRAGDATSPKNSTATSSLPSSSPIRDGTARRGSGIGGGEVP